MIAEAVLPIRVLPAWYQAWWFWLLLALGIFGAGAAAVSSTQRARARQDAERLKGRFEAMLEERSRIARELHDTLLRGFTGITLELQAPSPSIQAQSAEMSESLDHVLQRADDTLREARQMVWDIRAPELDHRNLILALEQAARNTIGSRPIRLDFAVEGEALSLSPVLEVALIRIGREAVANAVKHASPTTITVRLAFESRAVRLSVHDNGLGLDVAGLAAAASGGHWGIVGMRERAAALGGRLDVTSEPGKWTEAVLHLPVELGPSC